MNFIIDILDLIQQVYFEYFVRRKLRNPNLGKLFR